MPIETWQPTGTTPFQSADGSIRTSKGPRWSLLGALLGIFVAMPTSSQLLSSLFEDLIPTVDVTLEHPPSLGLTVDTVAFAEARGECADEFVNALIEDFVHNNVNVVERQRLKEVMEEIDFSVSGYIDQDDAIALGRILGPSALVFVEVQRCATDQKRSSESYKTTQGGYATQYYATTESHFKSAVRVVDLATGRIFSAKTVEKSESRTAKSTSGYPDYPSAYDLHDLVVRGATIQVHRMFFPWIETQSLRFFKDDKCNLKNAYQLLKIGDIEGASIQSAKNLEECKSQPKVKSKLLAHAYYNLGMTHFLEGEHDEALKLFEEAYRLKSGSRIEETILECKRAQQEAENMRRFETRMELAAGAERGPGALSKEPDSSGSQAADQDPVEERLRSLQSLLEKGLIDEEEYQTKREEILADL